MPNSSASWLAALMLVTSNAACGASGDGSAVGTGSDAATSAGAASEAPAAAIDADCRPLETREPNAAGQKPTFAGQTRACEAASGVALEVQ